MSAQPPGFSPCDIFDGRFADMVGPLYVRRDATGTCFGFRAEERHGNAGGAVHGGMLMTLADQVLGLTVMEAVDLAAMVTVSLNCDFVAAAKPGDWIEGRATVVRAGRSLVFVRGELMARGMVILSASGVWKRVRV